jgi:4-hydroxyphenylacetate 3-monooxygenase
MTLRSGEQYLASLRDSRRVIYAGQSVDVLEDAAFARTARAIAQFYDFQCLPENRDVMTFETPAGTRAGMAFKLPTSREVLRERAAAYALWAEVTCGCLGRSPDYMNACMAALAVASGPLARVSPEQGRRAAALYERIRDEDLCLTHTFIDPFRIPVQDQVLSTGSFAVLKETDKGIVVRGARGLATLAPLSNLNFNLGMPPIMGPDGMPLSCSFVVPVGSEAVRWICRDLVMSQKSTFDAPLSSRADEMDCVAIFDDCEIPWEDVCIHAKGADMLAIGTVLKTADSMVRHQVLVRGIAKLRFMLGLAHMLADSSGISQFINIRAKLGEIVDFIHTLQAFAVTATEGAETDPETGYVLPPAEALNVAVHSYGRFHKATVDILLELGASRHVSTPQEATLDALGPQIEAYFKAKAGSASQNVALCRLAWDVAGSEWGTRQTLYEQFNSGDPTLTRVARYLRYDMKAAMGMVKRILGNPPTPSEPFPAPKRTSG